MASYLYASNVSQHDRFDQIQMLFDNGSVGIIRKGRIYDFTSAELSRALRYVVLIPSNAIPVEPIEVGQLPIVGNLADGDVLVWDAQLGAFVPSPASGGGGGGGSSSATYIWNDTTSQYELKADAKAYVGPVPPNSVGVTMEFGDTWTPSEEPA
jgi:hypothetical protein